MQTDLPGLRFGMTGNQPAALGGQIILYSSHHISLSALICQLQTIYIGN